LRQNHALEHATIAILQERNPAARIIARSSSRGFRLLGTADKGEVQAAVAEALQRLRSGEHDLAIAPRCGTTVAVGVLFGTLTLWLSEFLRSPRQKLALAIGASLAIAISAQPVGLLAQRHVTTQARMDGVKVREIRARMLGRKNLLEVLTGR
jgi:sensor c-di-GMP phosphodiesterase-like protein